jgi:SNF2 family DNA or RNA helicase
LFSSFLCRVEKSPSKSLTIKTKDVKGSHSTKVEAIVETLIELQESHPGGKCIIFSSWVDVLEIIAKALIQNDISHCLLNQSGKKFQKELDRFKVKSICICLFSCIDLQK